MNLFLILKISNDIFLSIDKAAKLITNTILNRNEQIISQNNKFMDDEETNNKHYKPKRYFEPTKWKQIQRPKNDIDLHFSSYAFDLQKPIMDTNYLSR